MIREKMFLQTRNELTEEKKSMPIVVNTSNQSSKLLSKISLFFFTKNHFYAKDNR